MTAVALVRFVVDGGRRTWRSGVSRRRDDATTRRRDDATTRRRDDATTRRRDDATTRRRDDATTPQQPLDRAVAASFSPWFLLSALHDDLVLRPALVPHRHDELVARRNARPGAREVQPP